MYGNCSIGLEKELLAEYKTKRVRQPKDGVDISGIGVVITKWKTLLEVNCTEGVKTTELTEEIFTLPPHIKVVVELEGVFKRFCHQM